MIIDVIIMMMMYLGGVTLSFEMEKSKFLEMFYFSQITCVFVVSQVKVWL